MKLLYRRKLVAQFVCGNGERTRICVTDLPFRGKV